MPRAMDAQSVHLIVEVLATYQLEGAAGAEPQPGPTTFKLKVPNTHAFLIATPGEAPRVQATAPESMEHAAGIEPIHKGSVQPRPPAPARDQFRSRTNEGQRRHRAPCGRAARG